MDSGRQPHSNSSQSSQSMWSLFWVFLAILVFASLPMILDRMETTPEETGQVQEAPSVCFDWLEKSPEETRTALIQLTNELHTTGVISLQQVRCLEEQHLDFRRIMEGACRREQDRGVDLMSSVMSQWLEICPHQPDRGQEAT